MAYRLWLSVVLLTSLCVTACGSKTANDAAGSGNSLEPGVSDPDGHQAAQASFESVDNAATNDNEAPSATQSSAQGLSAQSEGMAKSRLPVREAFGAINPMLTQVSGGTTLLQSLSIQGCQVALDGNLTLRDSSSVYNGTTTFDPTGCTRSRKLSGSASIIGFLEGNVRTIAVTENMSQTLVNGDVVDIVSASANQPTYIITATGLPAQGNTQLSVRVNEHRHRLASTGNVVFDLTIATDANAPVQLVNQYGADANGLVSNPTLQARTIVSGVNIVVHNLAHYTAVHTFDNVHHTLETCNCPDSGSLKEEVTYADTALGSYARVYTFTACGEATVVTSASTHPNVIAGTTHVTWDSCH